MICEYCLQPYKVPHYQHYDYQNSTTATFCSPECYDQFAKDRIEDLKYERMNIYSAKQKVK